MDPVPEIRREKVYLQPSMSTEEIKKTYGLSSDQAYKAKVKGFFVKNYSKKQIVIDRENFNSAVVYPLAKKVFGKNFSKNPLASPFMTTWSRRRSADCSSYPEKRKRWPMGNTVKIMQASGSPTTPC